MDLFFGSLTHHDPRDLGLICVVKKRRNHFQILSGLRIQSLILLKKGTLKQLGTSQDFVHLSRACGEAFRLFIMLQITDLAVGSCENVSPDWPSTIRSRNMSEERCI